MRSPTAFIFIIFGLLATSSALAESRLESVAEFNITIEGNDIYVETLFPSQALLGFNYMPVKQKELKYLSTFLFNLEKRSKDFLVLQKGGGCILIESIADFQNSVMINSPQPNEAEEIIFADDDTRDTESGEESIAENGDSFGSIAEDISFDIENNDGINAQFNGQETDIANNSNEIFEIYTLHEYRCSNTDEITSIKVNILDFFPKLEGVNVHGFRNGEKFQTFLDTQNNTITPY